VGGAQGGQEIIWFDFGGRFAGTFRAGLLQKSPARYFLRDEINHQGIKKLFSTEVAGAK
jgi:hypothetical protein